MVEQTLEQVRELSLNLRPPMLDDLGLIPTLRWYIHRYAQRTGVSVHLDAVGLDKRLHPDVETAFYRVLQEALTNVARHAGATTVRLSLRRSEAGLSAYVEDDGGGFDVGAVMDPESSRHGCGAGRHARTDASAGRPTDDSV